MKKLRELFLIWKYRLGAANAFTFLVYFYYEDKLHHVIVDKKRKRLIHSSIQSINGLSYNSFTKIKKFKNLKKIT